MGRLTLKKNCFGCRANENETCVLDFETHLERHELFEQKVIYPSEPCPKPMTHKSLSDAWIKYKKGNKNVKQ